MYRPKQRVRNYRRFTIKRGRCRGGNRLAEITRISPRVVDIPAKSGTTCLRNVVLNGYRYTVHPSPNMRYTLEDLNFKISACIMIFSDMVQKFRTLVCSLVKNTQYFNNYTKLRLILLFISFINENEVCLIGSVYLTGHVGVANVVLQQTIHLVDIRKRKRWV